MRIFLNEILQDIESGFLYRVLWIDQHNKYAYLIDVNDKRAWPFLKSIDEIIEDLIHDQWIKNKDYRMILKDDMHLNEKERMLRDSAWRCIKDFVLMEPDIYIPKLRGQLVKEMMQEFGVVKTTVYKYLRRYWQKGKVPNALIPEYSNSGGRGIPKKISDKKIGRPAKFVETANNINVDENMKKIFRVAIKSFYLNKNSGKKAKLTDAYKLMIRKFFADDYYYENGVKKVLIRNPKEIPSLRQFQYWFKKEFSIADTVKKRFGENEYNRNHREILGSSTHENYGPGSRFQVDATIADVYLISEYNSNWIIGRPIVYLVIDVFSRMITGFYVGLEGPSWLGAMMAITNTVEDKQQICSELGIVISKEMWPCEYLPQKLLADRGEFEGYNIERLEAAFGMEVENTAPYRPDWKGIVESMFKTIHGKVKPFVPGFIDIDFRMRGGEDYRLDAKLTLKDFKKLIVLNILDHNNNHYLKGYSRNKELIEDDILPIPIKIWNWGAEKYPSHLIYHELDFVKLQLLPREMGSITPKGIRFKGAYYSCDRALKENWFSTARYKGRSKIEIMYDPRNLNNLYFWNDDGITYEICYLLEHQERYFNLSKEEIEYLNEYEALAAAQNNHRELQSDINLIDEVKNLINEAEKKADLNQNKNLSNAERVKEISKNRQREKELQREKEKFVIGINKREEVAEVVELKDDDQSDQFKRKSMKELLDDNA